MKQGDASRDVRESTKVEPKSHAINPPWLNYMGNMHGNHTTDKGEMPFKTEPMHGGAALRAPMRGTTQYHCGSQGKR